MFMLDTTAPSIAITNTGGATNQAVQTISGTVDVADAGATVTIFDGTTAVGMAIVQSNGIWSSSVTLAGGINSLTAEVTDAAGNTGTSPAVVFTLATTAPSIAIAAPVAGDNVINKAEAAAGVTISGTATAGSAAVNGQTATITLVDGGNAVKDTYTATVTNGSWSVNVSAAQAQALADGSYSIRANVSDAAGNAAPTATQVIAVDETAPVIAITAPVAGDNVINKSEAAAGVTISGTATAGSAAINGQTATITIVDSNNAVKDTYTATVSNGAWSVNVTATQAQALADGSYSIRANVSDAAGNAAPTATQVIAVDETAPVIAITAPVAGDNIVNKSEAAAGVTISGTATAGSAAINGQTATITIVDGSSAVKDTYTTTVSNGAWSVNVTAAQAQALVDGSYSIKANVSDAAGNAAPTASQAIALETIAPTVAIAAPVASDNIINKAEAASGVTISGTATAGSAAINGQTATITLVDGGNAVKDTYTATVSNGAWSVNVSAAQAQALADGSYSIRANVSDAAGNAAPTASQAIALETVAPTVAIGTAGTTTNQATQTISGTVTAAAGEAAVGATVTLFDSVNGGPAAQIGTATVGSGGAWSTSVVLSGNGSHSIVAQDTDAAGNPGGSPAVVFTLATTAPSIAIAAPVAGDNVINKAEAASGVTISGTATAGSAAVNGQTATITLVDGGNAVKDTYTATVTNGSWSVNVSAAQAQALADGSYSIKANVTDAAGNAAPTATQAIAVDETVPSIAITAPVAGDNIVNRSEAAAGVTISGTATAGSAAVNGQTATITIVDSSNAVKDTYTATVTNDGWSVNVSAAQAQALADGSYSIKANVSDAAGNAAPTATQAIALETIAPTVAIGTAGATTNQATQTISGTVTAAAGEAAVGSTVTLFDSVNGGPAAQIGTATVGAGGAWS
ncbi:MAG TPA: Ig-like domain-containing protein, partial [Bradyrhizobium sp.]